MKKLVLSLTAAIFLSIPTYIEAEGSDIKVEVNDHQLQFNQPPVIMNGRTLVPLRGIFEALGAHVDWDQRSQTVTAVKGDTTVKLTIGQTLANRNKDLVQLSVPATIINGSTMVPTRFIAESLGETVDWNGDTRTVFIHDGASTVTTSNQSFENNSQVSQSPFEKIYHLNESYHDNMFSLTLTNVKKTSDNMLDVTFSYENMSDNSYENLTVTFLQYTDSNFNSVPNGGIMHFTENNDVAFFYPPVSKGNVHMILPLQYSGTVLHPKYVVVQNPQIKWDISNLGY